MRDLGARLPSMFEHPKVAFPGHRRIRDLHRAAVGRLISQSTRVITAITAERDPTQWEGTENEAGAGTLWPPNSTGGVLL